MKTWRFDAQATQIVPIQSQHLQQHTGQITTSHWQRHTTSNRSVSTLLPVSFAIVKKDCIHINLGGLHHGCTSCSHFPAYSQPQCSLTQWYPDFRTSRCSAISWLPGNTNLRTDIINLLNKTVISNQISVFRKTSSWGRPPNKQIPHFFPLISQLL